LKRVQHVASAYTFPVAAGQRFAVLNLDQVGNGGSTPSKSSAFFGKQPVKMKTPDQCRIIFRGENRRSQCQFLERDGEALARARGAVKMAEANALELKRREQEITTRRAEIARSKANLALIDTQLADTVVASPVDGVVASRHAQIGQRVKVGSSLMNVVPQRRSMWDFSPYVSPGLV
jgi:biotin carboxyl carrier protein